MYKPLKNGINKYRIVYADYNTHNNNKHIKIYNSPGLWPRACYISRNRFLFYFLKKQEFKKCPPSGIQAPESESMCGDFLLGHKKHVLGRFGGAFSKHELFSLFKNQQKWCRSRPVPALGRSGGPKNMNMRPSRTKRNMLTFFIETQNIPLRVCFI